MAEFDSLIDDFIVEAKEHLETVEDDILEIEKQGKDFNKETINHLFRSIHSIKGGSSFMDLKNITKLSHSLENIIGNIREGKIVPYENITESLLKSADKLKDLINNYKISEQINIDHEINILEQIITSPIYDKKSKNQVTNDYPDTNEQNKGNNNTKIQFTSEQKTKETKILETTEVKSVTIENSSKPETPNGYFLYNFTIDLVSECDKKNRLLADLYKGFNIIGKIIESKIDSEINENLDNYKNNLLYNITFSTVLDDDDLLFKGLDINPVKFQNLTVKNKYLNNNNIELKKDKENEVKELIPVSNEIKEIVSTIEEDTKSFSQNISPEQKAINIIHPVDDKSNTQNIQTKQEVSNIRIQISLLDKIMNLASELVLARNQNMQAIKFEDMNQIKTNSKKINLITSGLQNAVMQTRLQPVDNIFSKFTRIVRDLCKQLNKEANLEIIGKDVELDKNIIESLNDPLTHLIRNAIDHGIEMPSERIELKKNRSGKITLAAYHQAGYVVIKIEDDGKGMDPEKLIATAVKKGIITPEIAEKYNEQDAYKLIFKPGFSTAATVSDISGRGVGMDVVKTNIQKLGGVINISSKVGKGSEFKISLPLTLTIIQALVISIEDLCFAIPQYNVSEVVWLYGEDIIDNIKNINGQEVFSLRGKLIPIYRLNNILKIKKTYIDPVTGEKKEDRRLLFIDKKDSKGKRAYHINNSLYILIIKLADIQYGLIVDDIIDTEEIVIKPLHEQIKNCKVFSGTTVLGDGRIAMILDIAYVANLQDINLDDLKEKEAHLVSTTNEDKQQVLVFNNLSSETFAIPLFLILHIEKIRLNNIILTNNKEFFKYQNNIIPLLRVEKAIPSINATYLDEAYVIILKSQKPIGILVSLILDSTYINSSFDTDIVDTNGIIGALMINNNLTLILDAYKIVEILEPNWFEYSPKKKTEIRKILIVEDTKFYQALLRSYLKNTGVEVTIANNGEHALKLLKINKFDYILSDIEMPIMDGLTFARKVRENREYDNVPLFALSAAYSEEYGRSIALEAGFDNYISKLNREEMIDLLRKML